MYFLIKTLDLGLGGGGEEKKLDIYLIYKDSKWLDLGAGPPGIKLFWVQAQLPSPPTPRISLQNRKAICVFGFLKARVGNRDKWEKLTSVQSLSRQFFNI